MYSFKLLQEKTCGCCGEIHKMLPKGYRPDDVSVYWECDCKSTLCTPMDNVDTSDEACECSTCMDSETPCFAIGDCVGNDGLYEMCPGCQLEAQKLDEEEFEKKKGLGYL